MEETYSLIETALRDARSRCSKCIVAGDVNAEVGTRTEFDNPRILGAHGLQRRNDRGNWLLQWCSLWELVIANTYFGDNNTCWTYKHQGVVRQIDYFLTDMSLFGYLQGCCAHDNFHIGSDHRPLCLIIVFCELCRATGCGTRRYCTAHSDVPPVFSPLEKAVPRVGAAKRNIQSDKISQDPKKNSQDRHQASPDLPGPEATADQHARDSSRLALGATKCDWRRVDKLAYQSILRSSLVGVTLHVSDSNLNTTLLEDAMVSAAKKAQQRQSRKLCRPSNHNADIKQLLHERRLNDADQTIDSEHRLARRKQLCKQIQTATRRALRERKTRAISDILSSFRGLKSIPRIHKQHTRPLIASMATDQGETISDSAGIASLFADFYEHLYAKPNDLNCTVQESFQTCVSPLEQIPPFTMPEQGKLGTTKILFAK